MLRSDSELPCFLLTTQVTSVALWSHLTGEATDTDEPVVGFGRLSTAQAMFEFRWPDCSPVPAYHRLPSLRGTGQRPSAVVFL